MPEALDNGSQPYSRAYGYGEMAGKATPHTRILAVGKGHTQPMSPTIKAGLYYRGQSHTSHFAVPIGTAVWLATLVRCLWHPHC